MSGNELISQLLDKFKKEISDDVKGSNEILIKKMEDLEVKVLNFLSIISGVVGANNAAGTTKTPKPSNRKVRVNENVVDISQFHISYDNKKDQKDSAALHKAEEKVQKTKYISNCINYILANKITFKDLNVHCNIDITEVKAFIDLVKTYPETERFEKLKELTRKFLESKDEIQKQRIKRYIDSLEVKDASSSLSNQ